MLTKNEHIYIYTTLRDIIDMLYRTDEAWKTEARERVRDLRDWVYERSLDCDLDPREDE